jgi:hypothetical protein
MQNDSNLESARALLHHSHIPHTEYRVLKEFTLQAPPVEWRACFVYKHLPEEDPAFPDHWRIVPVGAGEARTIVLHPGDLVTGTLQVRQCLERLEGYAAEGYLEKFECTIDHIGNRRKLFPNA